MTKELVLVHGRAQQGYDADILKKKWIDSWKEGLKKCDPPLEIPIAEDKIRFPFYGDTLAGLENDVPINEVVEVIVRGDDASEAEREFIRSIILDTLKENGITEEQIQEMSGEQILERGPLNWEWMQTALKALDYYVPYASSAAVSIRTRDVYIYLNNPAVRKIINDGVEAAFNKDVETVVVGHSLGSVVAYDVLRNAGDANGWKIPLYLTVGSPLAVTAIKEALRPIEAPSCVGKWFNAMDERDVVPLYTLDSTNFNVSPSIENKTDVDNFTDNHHGIIGYLSDAEVAKRLYDALS